MVRPARVAASGPRPSSGILAGCPFGVLAFQERRLKSKGPPLATTHSRPIAVHAKPFSTSVHKGCTCVVATSTKICTRGLSTHTHARASAKPPRPPTSSSFLPRKEKEPRLPQRPLQRHPFSGPQNSAGELLHDSLAGSDFHGPVLLSEFCDTFSGIDERGVGLVSVGVRFIPHRQFCLPEPAHQPRALTWPAHKSSGPLSPIRSLRVDEGHLAPHFANHSLYRMKLPAWVLS